MGERWDREWTDGWSWMLGEWKGGWREDDGELERERVISRKGAIMGIRGRESERWGEADGETGLSDRERERERERLSERERGREGEREREINISYLLNYMCDRKRHISGVTLQEPHTSGVTYRSGYGFAWAESWDVVYSMGL